MFRTDEQIYKEFGNKIKKLRKEKGLTQSQLAEMMGTTQSTIYKYEKGLRSVPMGVLQNFADIFETSVDLLIDTPATIELNYRDIETGKKLSSLRESHNLTRSELSQELNIPVYSLANFESGISTIPIDILIKLSSYFNISIDELVGVHIKSDKEGEEHLERVVISKNPTLLKTYERWNREVGVVDFSADEMNELINFAKYLVSKRKK